MHTPWRADAEGEVRATTSPVSLASAKSLVPGLFGLVAIGLLLPRLLLFFQTATTLVSWPWQFDYDEGINLNATVLLSQGTNIYRPNGPEAFVSAPYPPLLYLANLPFTWLFGPTFAPARVISLLSTIAIGLLVGYIAWRVTKLWAAGAVAGALWLSLSPVIVWSTLFKQDMPALALGVGGLAWVLAFPTGRRAYWAILLFALAFYTKQSAVAPAAAAVLWFLVRDFRHGLRFAFLLGAAVLAPFALFTLLTGGGYYEHMVTNHSFPWTVGRFMRQWDRLSGEYWPLILWGGIGVALSVAAWLVRTRRNASPRPHVRYEAALLAFLYLLTGAASSVLQMGYEGANYNHLLDLLVPLCVVTATVWVPAAWLWAGRRGMQATAVCGVIVLLFVGLQASQFTEPRQWYRGGWPSPEREDEMKKLSALVASTPGDIYSEDAYLLLKNGKRVLYDDPSTFVPLAKAGLWDDSVLNRSMRDRRFPLVLLHHGSGRWTSEWRAALEENYVQKFRGGIDTFEAKQHTDRPQAELSCTFSGDEAAIRLLGYALSPGVSYTGINRGGILRAAFYWQAQAPIAHDYASYLHVVSEKGERVAGTDNPHTGADRPTSQWQPASQVIDAVAVHLPPDLAPGRYRLVVGMYRQAGGTLHPLRAGCQAGEVLGDAVSLGWVTVY
ncbi:MAG: hypothetical protein M3437_13115 [Chloroflexota bacterium]|nr:hypothetical protein [Chloroflexota bacterium]MDQ5864378.1 hypothetical protein [Chloroflexota bacterium]